MEHLNQFLHFVNDSKKFVFEFVPLDNIAADLNKDGTYNYDFPALDKKRLKYNGFTLKEFTEYIQSNSNAIRNEINDIFDKEDKQQISEVHNKLKRLVALFPDNKNPILDKIIITYPHQEKDIFEQLSQEEKKEIIGFLKLELDLAYNIKEQIKKQEKDFSIKSITNKNRTVNGFKFKTNKVIDLHVIHLYLEGTLLSCDFKLFRTAFEGNEIKSPLKIKWLLKHRDKSNKRTLIYFLSQPIFESVDEDKELQEKILYVFADSDGKAFDVKSLRENFRQYNENIGKIVSVDNNKDWKKLVDEKVTQIDKYLKS